MTFNRKAFFEAIDVTRTERGLTWRDVGAQVDIAPSTLTRIKGGALPNVEGFCSLLAWMGATADQFHDMPTRERNSLPEIMSLIYDEPSFSGSQKTMLEALIKVASMTPDA